MAPSGENYSLCEAATGGSVKLTDVSTSIIAVEVSCCLLSRPDICGPPQNASIGEFLKSVPACDVLTVRIPCIRVVNKSLEREIYKRLTTFALMLISLGADSYHMT